jgi:hypothetical protein
MCSTGKYDWTKINKMTYLSGNKTHPVIIPCPVFDNFANGKKSLYCWQYKKLQKKYLRQPSIDFDFCNISSSWWGQSVSHLLRFLYNIYFIFVLFHVYQILSVSLDCPFLIASLVFSTVYLFNIIFRKLRKKQCI